MKNIWKKLMIKLFGEPKKLAYMCCANCGTWEPRGKNPKAEKGWCSAIYWIWDINAMPRLGVCKEFSLAERFWKKYKPNKKSRKPEDYIEFILTKRGWKPCNGLCTSFEQLQEQLSRS